MKYAKPSANNVEHGRLQTTEYGIGITQYALRNNYCETGFIYSARTV